MSAEEAQYAYVESIEQLFTLAQFIGLGVVVAWVVYVYTFQHFHRGHVIQLDYTTLLKKEVAKVKKERKDAEVPRR